MCSGALVFDYEGKNKHMHTTQAATDCKQHTFGFQELGSRRVEVDFSGGHLSSDGGALLLREMDASMRLCEQLAGCFSDFRDADFVEHELPVMLRQRILGLALGYEDINDHERLRVDPLLRPLAHNGGPTLTHLPLRSSPAIDAGDPEFTPPPDHDQRGSCFYRVFGGRIDVGSVETQLRPRCVTPAPRPTP